MDLKSTQMGEYLTSLTATASGIYLLERDGENDLVLYATSEDISLTFTFKTDKNNAPYRWKETENNQTRQTKEYKDTTITQTFKLEFDMFNKELITRFVNMEFKSGNSYYPGGQIGIQVIWLHPPLAPTQVATRRLGLGSTVDIMWVLPEPQLTTRVTIDRKNGTSWTNVSTQDGPANMVVINNQPTVATDYRIRASNSSGFSTATLFTVAALTPPSTPTNFTVARKDQGTQAVLTWKLGELVSKVQIQHRIKGTTSWNQVTENTPISTRTLSNFAHNLGYEFQVRAGNDGGWSAWSGTKSIDVVPLTAPTNAVMIRPYGFALSWTDPNPASMTGSIEVQINTSPGSYQTVAVIKDLHATGYHLGWTYPDRDYRLLFRDSYGRSKNSNNILGMFRVPTDLRVFHPYFPYVTVLQWSDPNPAFLTGRIVVQLNYYGSSWTTVAILNDLHATYYNLGDRYQCGQRYRLIFYNDYNSRVLYSNINENGPACRPANGLPDQGLDTELSPSPLAVYPSPTHSDLYLKLASPMPGTTYKVVDVRGARVMEGTLTEELRRGSQPLDVRDLKSGMYLILIDEQPLGRFIKK